MYVVDLLKSAGWRERTDFTVDVTASPAVAAILAHDPDAFARVPAEAVVWTPGLFSKVMGAPAYKPVGVGPVDIPAALVGASHTADHLAALLPWEKGNRANSLFTLGVLAARKGIPNGLAWATAYARAQSSGMIADEGSDALRHFSEHGNTQPPDWWTFGRVSNELQDEGLPQRATPATGRRTLALVSVSLERGVTCCAGGQALGVWPYNARRRRRSSSAASAARTFSSSSRPAAAPALGVAPAGRSQAADCPRPNPGPWLPVPVPREQASGWPGRAPSAWRCAGSLPPIRPCALQ